MFPGTHLHDMQLSFRTTLEVMRSENFVTNYKVRKRNKLCVIIPDIPKERFAVIIDAFTRAKTG